MGDPRPRPAGLLAISTSALCCCRLRGRRAASPSRPRPPSGRGRWRAPGSPASSRSSSSRTLPDRRREPGLPPGSGGRARRRALGGGPRGHPRLQRGRAHLLRPRPPPRRPPRVPHRQAVALSVGLGGTALLAKRPGHGRRERRLRRRGRPARAARRTERRRPLRLLVRPARRLRDPPRGRPARPRLACRSQVSARHFYGALVAGARVGFRHVHLALEIDAAYHHADGTFQAAPVAGMARRARRLRPPRRTCSSSRSLRPGRWRLRSDDVRIPAGLRHAGALARLPAPA